jgi:hypothetical protein
MGVRRWLKRKVNVEVDLQVLLADAAVGALQPGLEVAYHPMDAGKDLVRVLAEQMMRTLAAGLVVEAKPSQPLVSRPAIGAHDRPGGDALDHEVTERVGAGVVDDLHADSPGAGAANLNGHDDQCLDASLAATPEPRLVAADEALVDLDNTGERLPLGIDHGATQFVEHRRDVSYRFSPSWRCSCRAEIPGVAVVTR